MKNNGYGQAEILTPEQLDRLVENLPEGPHKICFCVMRYSASRISETLKLKWSDITEESLLFKSINTKTDESRSIYLNPKLKFLGQLIIGSIALFLLLNFSNHEYLTNLYFPFFKNLIFNLGLFFIPFALFVIIGSSNAVNLTDGLDGLATVPVMLVALSFALICYVVGNTIFAEYLQLQYIPKVGELSIFCGSIVGSCLGFLVLLA